MLFALQTAAGSPPRLINREEIRSSLSPRDGFVWIDLHAPNPDEVKILQDPLNFHPLAIEDCVTEAHFPKVDDYGEYLYMVLHTILPALPSKRIRSLELDLFMGAHFLVTYHTEPIKSLDLLRDRFLKAHDTYRTPAQLLYALLDSLILSYVDFIDTLADRLESIEEQIFNNPRPTALNDLFDTKKELITFRRIVNPQREVVNRLARGEFKVIPSDTTILFRDVFDHLFRVSEMCESYRDLIGGALESYLSIISNRTNEVMKTLTILSVIILPMSLIASIYGMNFDFMPELRWRYGYPIALVVMATVAVGMLTWFRKRKWI